MTRWIPVPVCNSTAVAGELLGVWLNNNEQVEWTHTILPDGRRIVSGFDILPFLPEKN